MIGTTLVEIHAHIEELASDSGTYYLVCARYGDRPVPASGLRFEDRASARAAARATEQYRGALRRYDPALPVYDVIVCQNPERASPEDREVDPSRGPSARAVPDEGDWTLTEPVLDAASGGGPDRPTMGRDRRVEFCHRVAAAVFETLSEDGHDDAGSAVMDAYFELAETVADPDDLCLYLLEAMANTLDRRLTPGEQAAVVAGAASRLPPVDPPGDPVSGALSALQARGLLGGYAGTARAEDSEDAPATEVRIRSFALSPASGRLPVLPIVVELARRRPDRLPGALRAVDVGEGWKLSFHSSGDLDPSGLVAAPITGT